MTLYDYLKTMYEGYELTVWDADYDMETYFYKDTDESEDPWNKAIVELSKMLTVTKVGKRGVYVNLSEVVESHIDNLKKEDLFNDCDIDAIMYDMDSILAGYVSENWMIKFVNALK